MIDRIGQQMFGIGNPVMCGHPNSEMPLKICESGIRHIIGHKSGNDMVTTPFRDFFEQYHLVKDWENVYYDLDFTKYRIN